MNFNFNNIALYVGFFASLFALGDVAKNKLSIVLTRHRDIPTDVATFYDSLQRKEFEEGMSISVDGYFMKYGQLNKPYSYVNSVWKPCSSSDRTDFNIKHTGTIHELRSNEVLFERNRIILPVQAIPDLDNISYGFLYDERFTDFSRSSILDLDSNVDGTEINKYSNPILILYDRTRFRGIENKRISIKGADIIYGNEFIDDYFKQVIDINDCGNLSNIYRPLEEGNRIVCISLLSDKAKVSIDREIDSIVGHNINIPLFLEGTFNTMYDIPESENIGIIQKLIPNTMKYMGQSPSLRDENDEGISFISVSDINITYRKPGTLGFYTEMNLFDEQSKSQRISELVSLVKNFSIDYKNYTNKQFGIKDKYNITFIFDKYYRNLFNSKWITTDFSNTKEFNKLQEEFMNDYTRLL